ncbi:MAG: NAD(P)H-hydrate dehydratase [Pseudomonadota bacterium]
MKIISAQQMRALDEAAIKNHKIPSIDLMEKAGRGLADLVLSVVSTQPGTILVIAGRGNNGGDGLVAARLLIEAGLDVTVWLLAKPSQLSPDAHANFERLKGLSAQIQIISDEASFDTHAPKIKGPMYIIDAVLGTGLTREVSGLPRRAIDFINASDANVVAADIPSGLNSNDGKVEGAAVKAKVTATFGLPKYGLFLGQGPAHAGRVHVIDIGIPHEEIADIYSDLELIGPRDFIEQLHEREITSHKGTYGHVVIFAGSKRHLGTGYLACLAALRAGCGLVTYCLPETAFKRFDARYPEIMCDAIPDEGTEAFNEFGLKESLKIVSDKQAIAIGPAIGTAKSTAAFVNALLSTTTVPCVVDADGLNVLDIEKLKTRKGTTVLTPHPGEMARLLKCTISDVQTDRIGFARNLSENTGAVVVLKGSGTAVALPDGKVAINPTGNPGMATAGMGDALSGIIASFIAQGLEAATACKAAVYLHGLAGDIAARDLGQTSVIASDVISRIGKAINEAYNQIV